MDEAAVARIIKAALSENNKETYANIADILDKKHKEQDAKMNTRVDELFAAHAASNAATSASLKELSSKFHTLDTRLATLESADAPLPRDDHPEIPDENMSSDDGDFTRVSPKKQRTTYADAANLNASSSSSSRPNRFNTSPYPAPPNFVDLSKDDFPALAFSRPNTNPKHNRPARWNHGALATAPTGQGVHDLEKPQKKTKNCEIRISNFPDPLDSSELVTKVKDILDRCHWDWESKVLDWSFGKRYDHYVIMKLKDDSDRPELLKAYHLSVSTPNHYWYEGESVLKMSVQKYGRDRVVDMFWRRALGLFWDRYNNKEFVDKPVFCWKTGTCFIGRAAYAQVRVAHDPAPNGSYACTLIKDRNCPESFDFGKLCRDFSAACAAAAK